MNNILHSFYMLIILTYITHLIFFQDHNWAIANNGNESVGQVITTNQSGNVFSVDTFSDSVDFDPSGGFMNIIAQGGTDVFIQTIDLSEFENGIYFLNITTHNNPFSTKLIKQ